MLLCWACRGSASARLESSPCCSGWAIAGSADVRWASVRARSLSVIAVDNLDSLEPEQLRAAVRTLMADAQAKSRELAFKQATIDKLTHENATLKRLKFAARSEGYSADQKSLIEETLDADLAALAAEIEALAPGKNAAE